MDDLADAMARIQACVEQRDQVGVEAVLDPDFALVLVHPARAVIPRARWLEMLPDYLVHSYVAGEPVIDVDGDVAAVLHRDEMTATVLGQDRSGTFVISDVWRRDDDGWRLWRRHSSPLDAGPMPA
jgi:ketosteroid isomerase-like protein